MTDYKYSPFGDAHECCMEIIHAQPAREQLSFKKFLLEDLGIEPATEGIVQGAGRSKLVEVLYKDIMSKGNVDFGQIPQSRGDLTRVSYYRTMQSSMDALNKLLGENGNEGMIRMNALHEALIAERQSFEFGYKVNEEILMYTYCSLVEALMDVIQENIVTYVDYLKETQNVDLPPRPSVAGNTRVDKAVDTWLSIRKKGEWKKLVDYYKNNHSRRFFASAIVIGAVAIVGMTGLLWAIRSLIYLYFYSAVKVDEKARAMSNFISAVSANETDSKAKAKQDKANAKLTSIAAFIETKVLREDPRVSKEIQQADAAITRSALTSMSQVPKTPDNSGYDFEF